MTARGGWLVLYVVWMALLVGGLVWGRRVALDAYAGPQAKAQWDEFRSDMERVSQDGPVLRRPPRSVEPPALVLMRDYFGVCLAGTFLFGSLLYIMVVGAVRGALTADFEPRDAPPA